MVNYFLNSGALVEMGELPQLHRQLFSAGVRRGYGRLECLIASYDFLISWQGWRALLMIGPESDPISFHMVAVQETAVAWEIILKVFEEMSAGAGPGMVKRGLLKEGLKLACPPGEWVASMILPASDALPLPDFLILGTAGSAISFLAAEILPRWS